MMILGLLALSLFVAWLAQRRGRSAAIWLGVCLFLSPLFGLLFLLLLPRRDHSINVTLTASVKCYEPQVMRRSRVPWSRL